MTDSEGLELSKLLTAIGRGRTHHEAVDALSGVGLNSTWLHVDRAPAGVLESLRAAALRSRFAGSVPAKPVL